MAFSSKFWKSELELVQVEGVELADEPGRALEDDRALLLLLDDRILEKRHQLVERLFELELEPGKLAPQVVADRGRFLPRKFWLM